MHDDDDGYDKIITVSFSRETPLIKRTLNFHGVCNQTNRSDYDGSEEIQHSKEWCGSDNPLTVR